MSDVTLLAPSGVVPLSLDAVTRLIERIPYGRLDKTLEALEDGLNGSTVVVAEDERDDFREWLSELLHSGSSLYPMMPPLTVYERRELWQLRDALRD